VGEKDGSMVLEWNRKIDFPFIALELSGSKRDLK
jgi:hypothetical protein